MQSGWGEAADSEQAAPPPQPLPATRCARGGRGTGSARGNVASYQPRIPGHCQRCAAAIPPGSTTLCFTHEPVMTESDARTLARAPAAPESADAERPAPLDHALVRQIISGIMLT